MVTLAATAQAGWYDDPLAVAFVSVVLTLLATQIGGFIERRMRANQVTRSLRMAFLSEITSIQGQLQFMLDKQAGLAGQFTIFHRKWPTQVYSANVGRLGDLNDPSEVGLLVELYSDLESLEDLKAQYHRGSDAEPDKSDSFYAFKLQEADEQLPNHYLEGIRQANAKACFLLLLLTETEYRDQKLVDKANAAIEMTNSKDGTNLGKFLLSGKKLLMRMTPKQLAEFQSP